MKSNQPTVAALVTVVLSMPAMAETADQEWGWSLTPYLWAAGIDGSARVGQTSAEVSVDFEDLVNVLRGGALVQLEGSNGAHGVSADIVYLRLKEEDATGPLGDPIELKLDVLIAEGSYFYQFNETVALEAGLRHWEFETTLRPELLPETMRDSSWTDGFIGVIVGRDINDSWSWQLRANAGGGGSEAAVGVDLDFWRAFSSGNQLSFGLRILDVRFENEVRLQDSVQIDAGTNLDLTFSGLSIGYRFNL